MLSDQVRVDSFSVFVSEVEPRLRAALVASFGPEVGREMTAEALAYGWEHWDRVGGLENPAGYLYAVGRSKGRRLRRRRPVVLPGVPLGVDPWIEPGLPAALASLTEQQRTVIALHHGYEWSLGEVADMLGVSKATVQNHQRRGLNKLRRRLGVSYE